MKDIIITTTNSIEGRTIESYLGMVNTNIVLGINVFSDFAASFSDFFGGTSETYQRQLQQSYDIAMSDLKRKATKLGASAIVGSRLDFDEISGKGKSMFMVSISGTAVKLKEDSFDSAGDHASVNNGKFVNSEEVQISLFVESRNNNLIPTEKEWEFMSSHYVPQMIDPLFELRDRLYKAHNGNGNVEIAGFDDRFRQYLSALPTDVLADTLHKYLPQHYNFCTKLLIERNIFSPKHILKLIENGYALYIIKLLSLEKPFYDEEDLTLMKTILVKLENLPEIGHYEDSKGGFLSSSKRKYICPDGHSNDSDLEYCSICGKNIRGLKQEDVEAIKLFASKVHIISSILQKSN